ALAQCLLVHAASRQISSEQEMPAHRTGPHPYPHEGHDATFLVDTAHLEVVNRHAITDGFQSGAHGVQILFEHEIRGILAEHVVGVITEYRGRAWVDLRDLAPSIRDHDQIARSLEDSLIFLAFAFEIRRSPLHL